MPNMKEKSVDYYMSFPSYLYDYITELGSQNYAPKGVVIRQMIGYVKTHDLQDEIHKKRWTSLIKAPLSENSTYVKMPTSLDMFIMSEVNRRRISKSEFIRCVVNYFYQNKKMLGDDFHE